MSSLCPLGLLLVQRFSGGVLDRSGPARCPSTPGGWMDGWMEHLRPPGSIALHTCALLLLAAGSDAAAPCCQAASPCCCRCRLWRGDSRVASVRPHPPSNTLLLTPAEPVERFREAVGAGSVTAARCRRRPHPLFGLLQPRSGRSGRAGAR